MNSDKLDNAIKDKFQNFEVQPPSHLWDNIRDNISDVPAAGESQDPTPPTSGPGLKIISTIIVIAIGAAIYFGFFNSKDGNTTDNSSEIIKKDISESTTDNNPIEEINISNKSITLNKPANFEIRDLITPESEIKPILNILKKKRETTNLKTSSNFILKDNKIIFNSEPIAFNNVDKINTNLKTSSIISPLKSKIRDIDLKEFQKEVQLIKRLNKYLDLNQNRGITMSLDPKKWMLGVFVTPERIFYDAPGLKDLNAVSFDIEARYQLSSETFIQSGINVNYSEDKSDYFLTHRSYDVVGSYERVYDVQVEIVDGVEVPTYHTNEVDVFDSINHNVETNSQNMYTYLQIPLSFGYTVNSGSKLSYSISTGPVVSFMIDNRQKLDVDQSIYTIVGVPVDNAPNRLQTNFQYLVSLGVNYEMNDKLSLYMEPRYKYYVNNIYQGSGNSGVKPYSIGLRFGVFYKLNNK